MQEAQILDDRGGPAIAQIDTSREIWDQRLRGYRRSFVSRHTVVRLCSFRALLINFYSLNLPGELAFYFALGVTETFRILKSGEPINVGLETGSWGSRFVRTGRRCTSVERLGLSLLFSIDARIE
jgi:hypothetical protein